MQETAVWLTPVRRGAIHFLVFEVGSTNVDQMLLYATESVALQRLEPASPFCDWFPISGEDFVLVAMLTFRAKWNLAGMRAWVYPGYEQAELNRTI